jgi:hypothetical protein
VTDPTEVGGQFAMKENNKRDIDTTSAFHGNFSLVDLLCKQFPSCQLPMNGGLHASPTSMFLLILSEF